MLHVIVLGAAAGGGLPQWNCGCPTCAAARGAQANLQRTQTSIAVSADNQHWFLVNASPDLRQQLTATPRLHPNPGHLRHSPIAGVILTNGEIDAVAGLLSMREAAAFDLYAHERILAILAANSMFDVLKPTHVRRIPIAIDAPFEPRLPDGSPSGLDVLPFAVPGKSAWYLEGKADKAREDRPGDTLGLRIRATDDDKELYIIAACAAVTPDLRARIAGAALVLFDGTLWRDDEMIGLGLSSKTGASMGHIAMSGDNGAIAALTDLGIARKVFIHINNSNPVLLPESPQRRAATEAGWDIASDGMEFVL